MILLFELLFIYKSYEFKFNFKNIFHFIFFCFILSIYFNPYYIYDFLENNVYYNYFFLNCDYTYVMSKVNYFNNYLSFFNLNLNNFYFSNNFNSFYFKKSIIINNILYTKNSFCLYDINNFIHLNMYDINIIFYLIIFLVILYIKYR